MAAATAVVAIALLAVPPLLRPQTGTLLVLAAGRTSDSLPTSSLQVHGAAGWEALGSVAGVIPAAPQQRRLLATSLAVGKYDAVRLGSDEAALRAQVIKGQVEPVLLGVAAGRLLPGSAYGGNDDVNLGLGELAGRFVVMPAFRLLDQRGQLFDNQRASGKDLVVAAFHTTCHTTCPLYTALFLQLQKRQPSGVDLVEVTTDPDTDTSEALARYGARVGAHWTLATGAPADVAAFWQPFGVDLATGDSHISTLALIDRHGYIRLVYRGVPDVGGVVPGALAGDLNQAGLEQLASHGDGWGAPQVLAALLTIAAPESPQTATGRAPDFALNTTDGRRARLSDFAGHPLVINFWATFCPPCRAEMPLLERGVAATPGVDLVLIDEGEPAASARGFLAGAGVRDPSLLDADLSVGRAYGVIGLPTTVFVRPDGSIEGRNVGAIDERVLASHLVNISGK